MGKIKRIPFSFKLDEYEYNKMYLSVLGLFLPEKLTGKEIDVLSMFVTIGNEMNADDCFNSYARKKVKEKLGISSAGLHNHMKSIMNKGYVREDIDGNLKMRDYLRPVGSGIEFDIKITKG